MKKGFTLLELIISLSIASILMMIITRMFCYEVKNYKNFIIQDRKENYSKEALRFIETHVEDVRNEYIEIEGNKLIIKKNYGEVNIIEKKSNSNKKYNMVIDYYNHKESTKGTNIIVYDIEDFIVYKNKNIIYVTIEIENGVKFERCMELNGIKKAL